MKRATLLLLFAQLAILGFAQTTLSYKFGMDTSSQTLSVHFQFTGTDSGKTYLQFPGTFANQEKLYRAIASVAIQTKGAVLHTTGDSAIRYITHKPNQKLELVYTLKQDWRGPFTYPKNFRAVIQKQYMQLTGSALLVVPKMDSTQFVQVRLDWSRFPKNWKIYNSLHADSRTFEGSLSLEKFQSTYYTAGDFRGYRVLINNRPVYVAIRANNWKFADTAMVAKIKTIIGMERNFWNDHSEPYYFVSLIPFDGEGSYNGTAMHQSFMLTMSQDHSIGIPVLSLLAHEYFHRWNGITISLKGSEFENKWFSEGFTEYYTYKLLYTSQMISLADYVRSINEHISDYYLSPVRNEDNHTLSKNYWSTRAYNHLPYKKGFVYALYIDQLIQKESSSRYSLDNIMFDLVHAHNNKQELTSELILTLVEKYAGKNIQKLHEDVIIKGATVPVAEQSLGQHVSYKVQSLGAFDIGFDLEASWKAKAITGLKENSEAWQAGIRNGQKLKGYSINYDNIYQLAEISIEENGAIQKINYYPMSAQKQEVPQFFLKEPQSNTN